MVDFRAPGRDFVNEDNPNVGTRIGVITRVDEVNMKADVKIITGGSDRFELDLTQAMCGPRSFWGGVPEVNSIVVIGYRRRSKHLQEAVILGYVPVGNRTGMRFDSFAGAPPSEIDPEDQAAYEAIYGKPLRYKKLKMRPGDVGGMSSSGAELLLSKDIRIVNRAGDLFELRDAERSLVSQAIHRVEGDCAAFRVSGPIRRGAMNLPQDVFKDESTGVLKDPDSRYFGRDELQAKDVAFADSNGKVLDRINNADFPPVTLANGKRYFYVSSPGVNLEDPQGGGLGRAYTEQRMELRHDTDLEQEVREEIDGFSMDRPAIYIEQVYGTLVGNDPFTTMGQRQYGQVLKPKIFDDFEQSNAAQFSLELADRSPGKLDEVNTAAGAYLFQLRPPAGNSTSPFAVSVAKQGKVYVNVPGSTVETDPSVKNISAELNFEGAVKARIGAAKPDNVSLHLTLEGGVHLDIGADSEGNSLAYTYRGAVKNEYRGVQNQDDVSKSDAIYGSCEKYIKGAYRKIVNGNYTTKATQIDQRATTINFNAMSGISETSGGKSVMVTGKSQFNYALVVMETIVAGGRLSTILAGGSVNTIAAGAFTQTVAAGASAFNNPAGAFAITVGTGTFAATTAAGAVTLTAGSGAMALTAGAGAVVITAGLAMNLTASVAISLLAPQVLLGGPPAVLGVARGLPMMPPGSPSLDWLTGLPLQGSALIRSI